MIGCGSGTLIDYKVETIEDKFDNYKIDRMRGNELGGTSIFDNTHAYFNPQRYISSLRDTSFSIMVIYQSNDWLFSRDGRSLVALVDGKRMDFVRINATDNHDISADALGAKITERVWYHISIGDLWTIAHADEVEIKITGRDYFITRHFTKKNFENLQRFIDQFGPTQWLPN